MARRETVGRSNGGRPSEAERLCNLVVKAASDGELPASASAPQMRAYLRAKGVSCTPLQARFVYQAVQAELPDGVAALVSRGTFGYRLGYARKAKYLSRAELSRVVGCSESYLSYLETGRRSPSPQMLDALADALGREPEWLRSGCDSNATQRVADLLARCHDSLREGNLPSVQEGLSELLDGGVGRLLTHDEMDRALLLRAQMMGRQGQDRAAIEILAPLVVNLLNGKCGLHPVTLGQQYLSAVLWAGVAGELPTGVRQKAIVQTHQILATVARSDRDDGWWRLAATVMQARTETGDLRTAVGEAESWLAEPEQAGSGCPSGAAALRWNLGLALAELGRPTEALRQLDEALQLHDGERYPGDGVRLRMDYASVLMRSRPAEVQTAIDVLESTLPDLEVHSYPRDLHQWHVHRARAEILAERPEAVESLLDPVLSEVLSERLDDADAMHAAWLTRGDAWMVLGNVDAAREAYERAGQVVRRMPEHRGLARRWRDVGDRLSRLGCSREAVDAYRRALTVLDVPELPGVPFPR